MDVYPKTFFFCFTLDLPVHDNGGVLLKISDFHALCYGHTIQLGTVVVEGFRTIRYSTTWCSTQPFSLSTLVSLANRTFLPKKLTVCRNLSDIETLSLNLTVVKRKEKAFKIVPVINNQMNNNYHIFIIYMFHQVRQ